MPTDRNKESHQVAKCNKPKNACKICFRQVTQKNGLRCQGACQSWVHYVCLNYTPGRISDIKKGIIKVTCPCPDCKTTQPKEYRTDEPFACSNNQCPANMPPRCDNLKCPTNKGNAINQTSSHKCPLGSCGIECKQHSSPQIPNGNLMKSSPPCSLTSSTGRVKEVTCTSGSTTASADIPGDRGTNRPNQLTMDAVAQMCDTVGKLTKQVNELMIKMKEMTAKGGPAKKIRSNEKANYPKPCNCPGNTGRMN